MITLYPPKIAKELEGYFIFLDTGVFITASKSESFVRLLSSLRSKASCSFSTIPSVLFEYTRGSETLAAYNKRAEFLKSLVDYIDPMKFLETISDFNVVMSKINENNKSLTDFQLAACLYNYSHSKVALLTGDFKAFPAFFPRSHVITVIQDKTKDIRNLGVYQFDRVGYAQAAQKSLTD